MRADSATAAREGNNAVSEELRTAIDVHGPRLGVHITFVEREGNPYTEIVRLAKELRVDAVVVGASTQAGHRLSSRARVTRLGDPRRTPQTQTPRPNRTVQFTPPARRNPWRHPRPPPTTSSKRTKKKPHSHPDRSLYFFATSTSPVDSAAMKASCGTSTRPTIFIRFLPSFCFSSSLRLRVMSPP